MATLPPPEIEAEGGETLYAWNAIARGFDLFCGNDPALWPERHRQFAAGLYQQLATNNQGEGFFKAAIVVIQKLETVDKQKGSKWQTRI